MSNKPLHELTPEELADLAKTPIPEDKLKDLPQVKRFIISEGIVEGEAKIPAAVVFHRYTDWCRLMNEDVKSISVFGKEFPSYFKKRKISKGFVYLLSPEGFDLSEEHKRLVNAHRKRISGGKTKKPKKENKTS